MSKYTHWLSFIKQLQAERRIWRKWFLGICSAAELEWFNRLRSQCALWSFTNCRTDSTSGFLWILTLASTVCFHSQMDALLSVCFVTPESRRSIASSEAAYQPQQAETQRSSSSEGSVICVLWSLRGGFVTLWRKKHKDTSTKNFFRIRPCCNKSWMGT